MADAWLEEATAEWESNGDKRGVADHLQAFKEWVDGSRKLFPKSRMPQMLEEEATCLRIIENLLNVSSTRPFLARLTCML